MTHMILNSLIYIHKLQIIYVNLYKDLLKQLFIYIDAIHILSAGYLSVSLIAPSIQTECYDNTN